MKIEELKQLFDNQLFKELENYSDSLLSSSISYLLKIGGKRLRPVLCLAGNQLFNGDLNTAMPSALALEFFHNFTLMHDDIMDEAETRRGKPTVHTKFDENTAILGGDLMMIKAYEYLSKSPSDLFSNLFNRFNTTAEEVCIGQEMDMDFEDRNDVSEEEYIQMISLKTSVLFGTSLELGARTARCSPKDANSIYNFGKAMGISFQLIDDYLDSFGNAETFGKRIGGDIIQNKKTYLMIKSLNNLNANEKSELENWISLNEFDEEDKIKAVKELYQIAGADKDIIDLSKHYNKIAIEELNKINTSNKTLKEELIKLSESLLKRVE